MFLTVIKSPSTALQAVATETGVTEYAGYLCLVQKSVFNLFLFLKVQIDITQCNAFMKKGC